METVTIAFAKDGKSSTVKVEGVSGAECTLRTAALENRLGTLKGNEFTDEYYARPDESRYRETERMGASEAQREEARI